MLFQCKTGAVVGKKDDVHWAQVIKAPGIFGVVEVRDEEGKAQQKGMEVIKGLLAEIEKGKTIQSIAKAIDTVWGETTKTILLCVPIEKSVTILLRGEGVAYLKRDGHIAKLRGREGTISGAVHDDDIVFLASRTLKDHVSEEKLFLLFDHLHADEIGEKLALELHEHNGFLGYAGLFVEICCEKDGGEEDDRGEEKNPTSSFASPSTLSVRSRLSYMRKTLSHGSQNAMKRFRELDVRITIILFVIFLVSVGVGIQREWSVRNNRESEKIINEIGRLYDEGVALIDLNAAKSRERLLAAQTLLTDAKQKIKIKSAEGRKLEELERQLALVLPRATQEYDEVGS